MIASAALTCLALNVYFESRGEPILGQYAVAQVTMNRAGWNPHRICPTVVKSKQFSWTKAKLSKVGKNSYRLKPKHVPKPNYEWDTAVMIAENVMSRRIVIDLSRGAHFYHADYVRPSWSSKVKRTTTIGRHVFYAAM